MKAIREYSFQDLDDVIQSALKSTLELVYKHISMIIYVAGPMRGFAEENRPAFEAAKKQLLEEYEPLLNNVRVIIPHDILPKYKIGQMPMSMYIRSDIEVVLNSNLVFMLKAWENSVGASAEHAVAKWAGVDIRYEQ